MEKNGEILKKLTDELNKYGVFDLLKNIVVDKSFSSGVFIAGGAISNILYNIKHGTSLPINDIDIYLPNSVQRENEFIKDTTVSVGTHVPLLYRGKLGDDFYIYYHRPHVAGGYTSSPMGLWPLLISPNKLRATAMFHRINGRVDIMTLDTIVEAIPEEQIDYVISEPFESDAVNIENINYVKDPLGQRLDFYPEKRIRLSLLFSSDNSLSHEAAYEWLHTFDFNCVQAGLYVNTYALHTTKPEYLYVHADLITTSYFEDWLDGKTVARVMLTRDFITTFRRIIQKYLDGINIPVEEELKRLHSMMEKIPALHKLNHHAYLGNYKFLQTLIRLKWSTGPEVDRLIKTIVQLFQIHVFQNTNSIALTGKNKINYTKIFTAIRVLKAALSNSTTSVHHLAVGIGPRNLQEMDRRQRIIDNIDDLEKYLGGMLAFMAGKKKNVFDTNYKIGTVGIEILSIVSLLRTIAPEQFNGVLPYLFFQTLTDWLAPGKNIPAAYALFFIAHAMNVTYVDGTENDVVREIQIKRRNGIIKVNVYNEHKSFTLGFRDTIWSEYFIQTRVLHNYIWHFVVGMDIKHMPGHIYVHKMYRGIADARFHKLNTFFEEEYINDYVRGYPLLKMEHSFYIALMKYFGRTTQTFGLQLLTDQYMKLSLAHKLTILNVTLSNSETPVYARNVIPNQFFGLTNRFVKFDYWPGFTFIRSRLHLFKILHSLNIMAHNWVLVINSLFYNFTRTIKELETPADQWEITLVFHKETRSFIMFAYSVALDVFAPLQYVPVVLAKDKWYSMTSYQVKEIIMEKYGKMLRKFMNFVRMKLGSDVLITSDNLPINININVATSLTEDSQEKEESNEPGEYDDLAF